jgi:general secretion pathway protein H
LLKADRNAAVRRNAQIATDIDASSRLIRSGATSRLIRLPEDVVIETLLSARCGHSVVGSSIYFFPSGFSCGGVIALTRSGVRYEIRITWLTGGIEIVAPNRA